jgi:hypothetical protein
VATALTGNTAWLDGGTAAATRLPPAASSTTTYGEDGREVSGNTMEWVRRRKGVSAVARQHGEGGGATALPAEERSSSGW